MVYRTIVTEEAQDDFDKHISYILFALKNEQAATNLADDLEKTLESLSNCAGALNYFEEPYLKTQGYKRINFLKHNYYMLYRVEDDKAIIESILHDRQDPKNWVD